MNIKKTASILALSIGLLVPQSHANASKLDLNENYIKEPFKEDIKNIPNFDKTSRAEIEAYQNFISQYEDLYENDRVKFDRDFDETSFKTLRENFGKEYDQRLKLAYEIETLKKFNDKSLEDPIKEASIALNGSDVNQIQNQTKALEEIKANKIDEYKDQEKDLDLSLNQKEQEAIDKNITSLMNQGKLYDESLFDDELKAELLKGSVLNSKEYYQADDDLKEKYDQVISSINNKKAKESYDSLSEFVEASDKEDFASDLENEDLVIDGKNFIASNEVNDDTELETESSSIENPSQLSETETSQSTNNESAFLTNSATSSKYKELSDAQQREIDAIDSNKDGKLSAEELDKSANYTSSLGEDSWLYPFTEKALESSEESDDTPEEADDTNEDKQADNDSTADTSTEGTTTEEDKPAVPQTVTIDEDKSKSPELESDNSDDNADDKEEARTQTEDKVEEKKEEAPSQTPNTSAASIVKTGIKGLGILVLILVLALIGYYILKKQDKKDNHR